MQRATPVFDEREVVTATTGLVMGSINRKTRIVAEQKSADGTVAYKEDIARPISSQDVFDLAYDASLGIDCSFPSLNTDKGLREELVGHPLKLVLWQETSR
jgi:hypothetical protein